MRLLLGVEIDEADCHCLTPLHAAACNGHAEVVSLQDLASLLKLFALWAALISNIDQSEQFGFSGELPVVSSASMMCCGFQPKSQSRG